MNGTKLYSNITVSSNEAQTYRMYDENEETYQQSSGLQKR